DFNGDGKPDLVVGDGTGLAVLLGIGAGSFQVKSTVPFAINEGGVLIPIAVNSVAVSSLRGNGKQDIVALADSAVNVLLGNGDGTFQNPVAQSVGGVLVASFVVGDFTGDGKPDIATSNFPPPFSGGPSVSVLAGHGDGTFAAAQVTNLGETANALA